jgi:hypothetical protein
VGLWVGVGALSRERLCEVGNRGGGVRGAGDGIWDRGFQTRGLRFEI